MQHHKGIWYYYEGKISEIVVRADKMGTEPRYYTPHNTIPLTAYVYFKISFYSRTVQYIY